ncbi:MAG: IS66 family insertion sequence element accessory protein TnpB [Clostridia bacterium]|nr:IS66 family insertion sequence element accessory protein TnpB [Clostridia bacterium]MBQ9256658.1 IS66 family insertion sequence element accessory protein TnpB [Acidaminococcaceae bacterium]
MFEGKKFDKILVAAGYTDMRAGLNGLASIIQFTFNRNPFSNCLFLFCGRRADRCKCIYWEDSGFVLVYKRLENGRFRWPRKEGTMIEISEQQLHWLMEGISISQKSSIQKLENVHLVV